MIKKVLYLDEQMARQAGGANCLFNFIMRVNMEKFLPIIASPEGDLARKYVSEGGKVFIISFPGVWKVSLRIGRFSLFNPFALLINTVRLLPLAWKLLEIIKKEKIDLLHTNSFRAHLAGFIASRLSKRPIIWHLREVPLKESIFIRLIGRRYVHGVIFMSEAIKDSFLQGRIPGGEMTVIYDGVSANGNMSDGKKELREKFGIPQDKTVVGMVGRLVPVKGHKYFIEAAQKIVKQVKNVKFLVVGGNLNHSDEDKFPHSVQSMVEEMGLSEYFIFTGFHPEPLKIMSAIDILVCPSIQEGFGMVILEALVCGTPVIASNVGGIPEILKYGGGILVPPKDPDAIAKEVVRLIENPDEQRRLSIEGEENARENFPIERTASKIEEFYEEILG